MTIHAPARLTEQEATLAEFFAQRRTDGAARLRERAWEDFSRVGLPNRRVESWHYTDMRAALKHLWPPRPANGEFVRLADDRFRLALAGSEFAAHPSALAAAPEGVTISSLRQEIAKRDACVVSALALQFDDPLVNLNTALMQDGAVIRIAPGARIKEPIEICALPIGEESSFLRSFVIVGEGAEATIVESHGVSSPGAHRNHALNLEIGPGANVDHVAIMAAPNGGAVRVISLLAILAAGASFNSFGLIGNGGFVRRQIFVRLEGEGASATLGGATMSREADHADTTIHVEHAAQNTRSREHFRHIVDGAATGVFQGKIVVRSNAQKTSGAMQSRAILLSDNATMNNKPELEIFADDVQCGHGVTCGRLDKDQLFYLMARGLPRAEAEALLIEGFANEVFADVRNEALREELHGSVAAWLLMRSLAGEAS